MSIVYLIKTINLYAFYLFFLNFGYISNIVLRSFTPTSKTNYVKTTFFSAKEKKP